MRYKLPEYNPDPAHNPGGSPASPPQTSKCLPRSWVAPWSTSHGLLAPYVALPARGEGALARPGPAEPLRPPHVSKAGTRLGVKRSSQAVSRRPKIVDTDTPTPDFTFGEDPAPTSSAPGCLAKAGSSPAPRTSWARQTQ